jgi:hypothetical protein
MSIIKKGIRSKAKEACSMKPIAASAAAVVAAAVVTLLLLLLLLLSLLQLLLLQTAFHAKQLLFRTKSTP